MSKYSVVIIEDNLEDSEKVRNSLSSDSYILNIFADGLEAWAYLKANGSQVDVVIMGKTIPNISGMQILNNMQKHASLKNVPVIIQTVDAREGRYANAISQGAQFYLTKPLDSKRLLVLVKTAIRTSKKKNGGGGGGSFGGSFAGALRRRS